MFKVIIALGAMGAAIVNFIVGDTTEGLLYLLLSGMLLESYDLDRIKDRLGVK